MIYNLIKKKKLNLDKLSLWPQLIVSGVHNVFVFLFVLNLVPFKVKYIAKSGLL